MRFVLVFFLGAVLSFYLISLLFSLRYGSGKIHKTDFHHSLIGFIFFISAALVLFLGKAFIPDPINVLLATFLLGSGSGIIVHHLLYNGFIISETVEQDFMKRHDNKVERFLEILPGALTWLALTSPIWLSFAVPFAVAYLILLADIYWMFSAFKIAVLIYIGYNRMETAKKQNWLHKLKTDFPDEWSDYYHLVLIPTFKEGVEILGPTYEAIAKSNYPTKQIFLAVGFEGRDDPEKIEQTTNYLKKISNLGGVFTTVHPFGLPGEVPGPATNRNWMVMNAVEQLRKKKIDPKKVLVTTLDADFVLHPEFLGGAIHKYLSTPADVRDKRAFTGTFLYNNNYWQAPTPMRVIATGTAFWQISEMVGSDKYIHFSSLSINLNTLLDCGLWIPDKVNDDAGFYWKNYYHFNGDYKVIPHYLPLSADAVLDTTLFKTFQNQYLQLKRWAYGVEHMPFIYRQYFKNDKMDFWDKTDKLIFITWSYFKWGTLALFITFAGLFIPLINPTYAQSVVYYNLSVVSSWILTFAFVGLFSTIYFNEKVAPPRPKNWSLFKRAWSYIQWILVPIVLVSITTIPAIDAQTSLMLGRKLEFRVTRKARTAS